MSRSRKWTAAGTGTNGSRINGSRIKSLSVNTSELHRGGYAIERQHVGRGAVIDAVLFSIGGDRTKAVHHDFFKAGVYQFFVPEESLAVLHPFKVRNSNAPCVGQDVRDYEDLFVREDLVGEANILVVAGSDTTPVVLAGFFLVSFLRSMPLAIEKISLRL